MKNKGYTLLELMLVIAIILIFTGGTGLSLSNYSKTKDYKEITEKLSTFFYITGKEADDSDERIDIEFDYGNYLILCRKAGNIVSKFQLPKRYLYSNNGGTNIHFNDDGNISPMFTLEVKDGDKEFFKLTFISTDKFVKTARINKKMYIDSNWVEVE